MIDVTKILYEICGDEHVYDPEYDLIESGLLDSLAMIELFSALEDEGVVLQPTRIDRNRLRTSKELQKLVDEYIMENK